MEPVNPKDYQFSTGAVRSSDVDDYDFCSLPMIGLLSLARNGGHGGRKYGRFNYMLGMPAHTCVNHAFVHILRWAMGDRSEAHLTRAAWNCLVAEQSAVLNPELNAPHLPGPGYTITEAMQEDLEATKAERARRRAAGEFEADGLWSAAGLAEVQKVLADREADTQRTRDREVDQILQRMASYDPQEGHIDGDDAHRLGDWREQEWRDFVRDGPQVHPSLESLPTEKLLAEIGRRGIQLGTIGFPVYSAKHTI